MNVVFQFDDNDMDEASGFELGDIIILVEIRMKRRNKNGKLGS